MDPLKPIIIDIQNKPKKIFEGGGFDIIAFSKEVGTSNISVHLGNIKPGQTHEWHSHEQDEIMYFVQGAGKYLLKDGEMHYKAGNFGFIPKGTMHKNVVLSKEDVIIVAVFN